MTDVSSKPLTVDPGASDLELARAFQKGSEAAAGVLVERHGRPLMAYLRAKSPEAEDLFQETWLRAFRRIGSFKGGNFRAWLTVIARNGMIDRSRRRQPTVSLDAHDETGHTLSDTLRDGTPTAPVRLAGQEDGERILERIQALPADQREVFLLRTQQELSFAEIARLLHIPLNTALGRMHYAVTKLRRELGMDHGTDKQT
jgi:RNA polymerase sigma factor (sigma-70 family)